MFLFVMGFMIGSMCGIFCICLLKVAKEEEDE